MQIADERSFFGDLNSKFTLNWAFAETKLRGSTEAEKRRERSTVGQQHKSSMITALG